MIHSPLLTDLYQLTMAYGYWKNNLQDRKAVFHLFFRKHPFKGKWAIAAGLESVIEYLDNFRFTAEELQYLSTLKGNDGAALFEQGFLDYLASLKMDISLDAIPEGNLVFAHEPLLRVAGNLVLCQLLETPLLNLINFQTLIATKAARVCLAAKGDAVMEFGLRRAQGQDGGMTASRSAYIGGCTATSNVLAGMKYGIPVKGTHAHSWVMSFADETEAFSAYAKAMPNNCIFLVDTYNTLEGVKYAIEVGKSLREKGYALAGIRLDSGDLADLSIESRKLLDAAGFADAKIVASNDLDEYSIRELKARGAKIDIWGVGTNLVTAADQPALGGVYKLGAIENAAGEWEYRIKLSEQPIKISNPGALQVWRKTIGGKYLADQISNEHWGEFEAEMTILEGEKMTFGTEAKPVLVPIYEAGKCVYARPSLLEIHELAQQELQKLPDDVLAAEATYPVGLSQRLQDYKLALIEERR